MNSKNDRLIFWPVIFLPAASLRAKELVQLLKSLVKPSEGMHQLSKAIRQLSEGIRQPSEATGTKPGYIISVS